MRPIFVVVGRQVQQENTPFSIPDFPFHTRKHKTSDREVEVVGIVVAFTLTAVAFREGFFQRLSVVFFCLTPVNN